MGDQIGRAVEGTLYHVPHAELQRLRTLDIAPHERAQIFADACRLNALYMIARAGSGHIGSSFSSLDIMSWLLLEELSLRPAPDRSGDVFFSSKVTTRRHSTRC
jgi:transketolase